MYITNLLHSESFRFREQTGLVPEYVSMSPLTRDIIIGEILEGTRYNFMKPAVETEKIFGMEIIINDKLRRNEFSFMIKFR